MDLGFKDSILNLLCYIEILILITDYFKSQRKIKPLNLHRFMSYPSLFEFDREIKELEDLLKFLEEE